MTKEFAIAKATQIAKELKIVMAVIKDPISNNAEEEPDGPWAYCPDVAKREDGKYVLFPYAEEIIILNPFLGLTPKKKSI